MNSVCLKMIFSAGFLHPGPVTGTLFGAVTKGISLSSFSSSPWSARYIFVSPGDDFPEDEYRMAAIHFLKNSDVAMLILYVTISLLSSSDTAFFNKKIVDSLLLMIYIKINRFK